MVSSTFSTLLYFQACDIYSWNLWYMFLRSPYGLNLCLPELYEAKSFRESYSFAAPPNKISTLQLFRKREVKERLCIAEVGVDLELCVHAHGHDVHLLIEASFKINYSLGISSSYIWDLAFMQSWFWPCSPLNTISCASLSTCLL